MFKKTNLRKRLVNNSPQPKPFQKSSGLIDNIKGKVQRFWFKRSRDKSTKKISFSPKLSPRTISYLIFVLLILVVAVPAFFLGNSFIKGFYGIEFHKEIGDNRVHETEWKEDRRINVLLIGLDRKQEDIAFVDYLTILVIDPQEKTAGIFNIDTNTTVYVPTTKTRLALKKLYNAGNDHDKPQSLDLIVKGVEDLTASSIDRYLVVDEDGLGKIFTDFGSISVKSPSDFTEKDISTANGFFEIKKGENKLNDQNVVNFLSADEGGEDQRLKRQNDVLTQMVLSLDKLDLLLNLPYVSDSVKENVKSDFTKAEFRSFLWQLRAVPSDKIRTGYTKQNSLVVLNDEKEPILERIDSDLSEVFFNIEVQKEQSRVEVLNGTSTAGIATKRARNIANTGAKVISVSNSRDLFDKTTIYTSDPQKYKNTIKEINNFFEEKPVLKEEDFPYRHTGDVVLVIGKDSIK